MQERDAAPRGGPSSRRRSAIVVVAVVMLVAALLVISRPAGATYDKYLQLKEGMSRQQVLTIISMDDYWHHAEGDKDVTSWVNKDGTYIRAVFDKNGVLVEVSWESGWDSSQELPSE